MGESNGWGDPSFAISGFEAVEYVPFVRAADFNPVCGQTLNVFVDIRFIANSHSPIADRKIYGYAHYSPETDIAAMVVHSGVLFVDPKYKDSQHRQFCTTKNVLEAMCCSTSEYPKRVEPTSIPIDLTVLGVVIALLFTNSPASFTSINKNGLRSRDGERNVFSMRISQFRILTPFDEMPKLVPPTEIVSISWLRARYRASLTDDVGLHFNREFFLQIFSLHNIANRLMAVYRLFFDVGPTRYELILADEEVLAFSLIALNEPVPLMSLKRRIRPSSDVRSVVDFVPFWDIEVHETSIMFDKFKLGPLDCFLLMTTTGKCPQLSRFKASDD
jgi:hypothetical protein